MSVAAVREIADSNLSETVAFKGLLSDEILSKNRKRGRISYGHNILFDFGVSKLFTSDERNVISFCSGCTREGDLLSA